MLTSWIIIRSYRDRWCYRDVEAIEACVEISIHRSQVLIFSRVISRVAKLISDLILEMIYQEIFKISKSKVSNIPSLFQVETISSRNFTTRSRYHGSLQWSRLNRGGSSDTSFHEDSASVDRRSIPIGNSSRERVDFMAIHCHGSIVSHCLCYSLRC